jgi:hypothetical protein
LGLGELLDRSVNFWRANWKPLFQLMVGFQLVELTLVTVAQTMGRFFFPLARDGDAIQRQPLAALPHFLGAVGLMLVAILGSLFVSQVAGVATTHFAFTRLSGRGTPSAGDSFRHASARLGTTAGAFALSLAWTGVVGLLLLLPGLVLGVLAAFTGGNENRTAAIVFSALAAIVGGLGALVLVLWFVIRFILVSQVIATEPVRAFGAFKRADALSSGRVMQGLEGLVKVRLTVLVTVIGGVLLIVSIVASLPTLIAGALSGASFEPGHTLTDVLPLAILLPLQLVQTVLGALVAPLYVVFQTFFYVDMRVRREALDLELALTA